MGVDQYLHFVGYSAVGPPHNMRRVYTLWNTTPESTIRSIWVKKHSKAHFCNATTLSTFF